MGESTAASPARFLAEATTWSRTSALRAQQGIAMLLVEPLRGLPPGGNLIEVVIGEELHHVVPELLSVTVLGIVV